MFYADVSLSAGASVPLDPNYEERAIYTVTGDVEIAGDVFGPAQLLVFRPGDRITIRAKPTPALWRLEGILWMAPGTFGGILCPQGKIASSRPKQIGRWESLTPSREIPNSSRFRSPTTRSLDILEINGEVQHEPASNGGRM